MYQRAVGLSCNRAREVPAAASTAVARRDPVEAELAEAHKRIRTLFLGNELPRTRDKIAGSLSWRRSRR